MDAAEQLQLLQTAELHLADHGQVIEVRRGDCTITAYRKDDLGLRNVNNHPRLTWSGFGDSM